MSPPRGNQIAGHVRRHRHRRLRIFLAAAFQKKSASPISACLISTSSSTDAAAYTPRIVARLIAPTCRTYTVQILRRIPERGDILYADLIRGDFRVEIGQPITGAVDRVQQRFLERLVYNFAQIIQMAAQRVGIGQQIAPHFALDVAPADHARRLAHQDAEQLQSDRRHGEFLRAAREAQRGGVEHEIADFQHFGADLAAIAADQRAHARFEFADFERLDQIIVRAGIQAGEFVVERVARGEHQHGRGFLHFAAQPAADFEAIHTGQHEIENDHVVAVRLGQMQAGNAVAGVVEAVAAAFEEFADHLGNAAIVFHQQDQSGLFFALFHRCPPLFTFVKSARWRVSGV